MSQRRAKALGVGIVTTGMLAATVVTASPATGAPAYTRIDQAAMTAVAADSVETSGEGPNGPISLILDGDESTYWHTQWSGSVAPLPHWFVVKLGDQPVDLGRVDLTPRQSSNGSGRVHEYKLYAVNTPQCTKDSFGSAAPVASGQFDGLVANKARVRSITLDTPIKATCVKVQYDSSWGGASGSDDTSPAEQVASLAEFNAFTVSTPSVTPTTPAGPLAPEVPEGALSIGDGTLSVRLRPDFPQIIDYNLAGRTLVGQYGSALSSMTIDGKVQKVTVGKATVAADKRSVSYPVAFPGLKGVHLTAVVSVNDGTLTYKLTNIVDPDKLVHRIAIPGLDLVSLTGTDAKSRILAAGISVSRETSGDKVIDVAKASPGKGNAWMVTANNSTLAAGFETNAIGDNTVSQGGGTTARFVHTVKDVSGTTVGSVSPAQWTYRSGAVTTYDDGSGIGPDDDPMIQVRITADANADGVIDWQDGAIATRHILTPIVGADEVRNHVIAHIPFNIVSQATHPFLRTLDDVKRVSVATDGLGQEVLLKGYQAEGHDSAQGDYAGHYNDKAGGLSDLRTLVSQGKEWNATFGIHVNATESYSEAKAFGPDLLQMPPQKAWGWMNQAYYMNGPKDLATGAVLERLAALRKDFPADSNLNWLYWDVYYPRGWEGDRFAAEVAKQGWRQGSEWADAMPRSSTWSHWANDENYGGSNNKGLNSQLIRFVENSYRDTWNPDPVLGNTNVVEFEGWTGHNDYNAFIANVWQRNLPTKFMQRSPIMSWSEHEVKLADGTVATSPLASIDGRTIPTNRTITTDGAVVYHDGTYLLPWKDGGKDRLYYWNPSGKAATWQLTKAWASQSSLTLFKLTDTGRVKVADLPVSGGKIALPATEANTAYVLYPTSAVPAAATPNWGEGSHIVDPGFFSGTTNAYRTSGSVTVTKSARGNFQAELGSGASSLSQQLALPAGTWSAWAWVQVQPGATRHVEVAVSGSGVSPAGHQAGRKGEAVTSIDASTAPNATASDEKVGTYFQRVPVRFTSDGSAVTLAVRAGDGSAIVSVDDLRIVPTTTPNDSASTESTIVYEDFEHIDDGYGPFVTGQANAGGDARTQLAEKHAPYSQSGWYGLVNDSDRAATKGQKYLDNVLDGQWSLMAHQENGGLILRTTQGLVPLAKGHTYRVSFDYQTAYDDDYSLVVGHDSASGKAWKSTIDRTVPIAQARGAGWHSGTTTGSGTKVFSTEFAAGEHAFFGIVKQGGKVQGDLVIDRFRVEDLGAKPILSVASKAVTSSDPAMRELAITASLALSQGSATDVKLSLTGPQGWTVTPVSTAATSVSAERDATASWTVKVPRNAAAGKLEVKATWTQDGKAGQGTESIPVDPGHFPLIDPISGTDLTLVEASSEQTGGAEPAPNGPAAAAIDGDPSTYWHTQWHPTVDKYPHYIVIRPTASLTEGTTCQIKGLEYTARQSAANGRAKGYQVYVSTDGKTWGDPVASGDFADVTTPQVIEFAKPVPGPFVKLVETSSQNGAQFGGAGEIRLSASCSGSAAPTPAPNPTPTTVPTPGDTPSASPTPSQPAVPGQPSTTPSQPAAPTAPNPSDTAGRPSTPAQPGKPGTSGIAWKPGKPSELPHTGASGDDTAVTLTVTALLAMAGMSHLRRR
ncbi:endo-alpha-N-acetylgalactosaminidase family protein [Cutibacterium equinum]|uniref:Endo-alpha-N-acetylgalactosaminidase family protein n=1 Tax=Cutibacterium equinum TaxID=3016342 RepID=A0ABY7QX79_9ACTN|nr:endo-alpha-N-acetylgalactosaminidase family protein [Cutibacterium equinum]WCC79320.1 endo-alpha-N-acetylgalactosaminidase family protein [Cutibacterium equinum]